MADKKMNNRNWLFFLMILVISVPFEARAIQICHDYTYYRITNKDENNLGITALENYLDQESSGTPQ
jgi:hypothetical protein